MPARLVIDTQLGQYNAAYQAGRHVARSTDGTWFYAFQDGVVGRVVWATPNGLVEIPLVPQPTMRPTFYADPSGLYCTAGMDGDKKRLMVWYIEECKSVYASTGVPGPKGDKGDPGPAGPPGAPGTGGGTLSARYTQALERLCAWLGI